MTATKSLFASKTVWGALIVIVMQVLTIVGATPADVADTGSWLDQLVTLAGAGIAIYGRIVATKRLSTPLDGEGGGGAGGIPPAAPLLVLAVGLAAMAVGVGGCVPSTPYVAADRATYEAIAPEYRAYVAADPDLTPEQKDRRDRTLRTWELRLSATTKPLTR